MSSPNTQPVRLAAVTTDPQVGQEAPAQAEGKKGMPGWLKWLLGTALVLALLFWVVVLSGFWRVFATATNTVNTISSVPMAVPGIVLATPVPLDGQQAPAEALVPATHVTNQQVLDVLGEIDQLQNMSRDGVSRAELRYEVASGNQAAGALVAKSSGTMASLRVVCDDFCTRIYYVSGNQVIDITGEFAIFVPDEAQAHSSYPSYSRLEDVSNFDPELMLGASKDDILTQWIGTGLDLNFRPGDYIVVYAEDDSDLQVNVGTSFYWTWAQ